MAGQTSATREMKDTSTAHGQAREIIMHEIVRQSMGFDFVYGDAVADQLTLFEAGYCHCAQDLAYGMTAKKIV